ncbi:hypothetical protein LR48_Vigan09g060200 [Vigna angularis]|uniref:Uncharacterized protein n=1 Tax=Phaseolus angularis TaxID=3914 RepID=A0A0L9VAD3_PHAAN|nr:uncharacterized protein LOC108342678 [Vigna angularis]KOM51943.1 hypothetical protein LR48_Vigan09g060200 [Vigna angularis]
MEVSNFFSFIVHNPEAPLPYPWERIIDLQRRVVYYKNNVTEDLVFDSRSSIHVGGGIYMDNSPLSSYMNNRHRHLVHQLIRAYQLSDDVPRVFLFSIGRHDYDRLLYHIVQESTIQCPSCNMTIRGLP